MKLYFISVALSAMTLTLGWSFGKSRAPFEPPEGMRGSVAHESIVDPEILFVAPGVTEPQSKAIHLTAASAGLVREIHVRAGDQISCGQVLVELEDDFERSQASLYRAQLDVARSELERVANGALPAERDILRAQLEEAEARLELARFEATSANALSEQDAVSDRERASIKNGLAVAAAQRDAAGQRLLLAEAGERAEVVARARAEVRAAEAALESAERLVERKMLRSPIDGIVIYRHREPGEAAMTENGTPILTVGDCRRLHVRVDVDEFDVGQVHMGQLVFATADAFPDRRFEGRVVHIEPTLGAKNFRTRRPTERLDTRIQEVVVELDSSAQVPLELQMAVWFLADSHDAEHAYRNGEELVDAEHRKALPASGTRIREWRGRFTGRQVQEQVEHAADRGQHDAQGGIEIP